MIEISLMGASGEVTMNDVMVSLAALGSATAAGIGTLVVWRQRAKDEQIKARDETIEFLKIQIVYLQNQLKDALSKSASSVV